MHNFGILLIADMLFRIHFCELLLPVYVHILVSPVLEFIN